MWLLLPVKADVLQGGINYNVNSARSELLNYSKKTLDKTQAHSFYKDNRFEENNSFRFRGNISLNDRILAFFSDNTYAVMYNDNPLYVWYYSKDGDLIFIETKSSNEYPYKTYKYTPQGRLVNMSLRVSKQETYIFTPLGKLIAHWVGAYAYDEKNNVIMTREYK